MLSYFLGHNFFVKLFRTCIGQVVVKSAAFGLNKIGLTWRCRVV